MAQSKDRPPTEAEKRLVQQETGAGRTAARPADVAGGRTPPAGAAGIGSGLQPGGTSPSSADVGGAGTLGTPGNTGVSGMPTNDAEPGGGTTGERTQGDVPARKD